MIESPEQEKPPQPVALNPVCPYCGTDPATINCRDIMFPNGVLAELIMCATPTCRKILSVSFAGRVQSEQRIKPAARVPIVRT